MKLCPLLVKNELLDLSMDAFFEALISNEENLVLGAAFFSRYPALQSPKKTTTRPKFNPGLRQITRAMSTTKGGRVTTLQDSAASQTFAHFQGGLNKASSLSK